MDTWMDKLVENRKSKQLVAVEELVAPTCRTNEELVAPNSDKLVAQNELVAPTKPKLVAVDKNKLSHLGQGKKLPKEVIKSIVSYKLSYPKESNRAIARRFEVSEMTIRRLIREIYP